MNKIDIVIPYVNGLDPEWQKIHCQYKKDIDYARFDGNDILKYVLRSIDMYLPWINKVHLLVMQESQVPEYVNQDTVHIVFHKDFIPEEHLPTFNSNTIEMYLWNIPELSENFIYINDDIIFNRKLTYMYFFSKNMEPLTTITKIKYSEDKQELVYFKFFYKSIKLAAKNKNIDVFENNYMLRPGHGSSVFKRSNLKNIYEMYKTDIEESITKFREDCNINQYFWSMYQFLNDPIHRKKKQYTYIQVVSENINKIKRNLLTPISEICLNDVETTTVDDKIRLQEILSRRFYKVSKYEKKRERYTSLH